jgi:integrase
MRNHVIPQLGQLALQQLTPGHLNKFYADLLTDGRSDGRGALSPRTVRYVHTILRRALQAAMRWRHVTVNVADAAEPPAAKQARRRSAMKTWSAADLATFLRTARDHRLYSVFVVLGQTGMRRGEALGARWEHLDLDARRWAVVETLVYVNTRVEASEPKTDHGRRSVALDAATVRVLQAWRRQQVEERLAFGASWEDTGRVFTREDGTDLHPERVSEAFDRLVRKAGVPRIRLHDLRHTHATLALQAGVHPKVVSERLGHASVTITLDTYSHAIPAMQEDAADLVAGLVGLDR